MDARARAIIEEARRLQQDASRAMLRRKRPLDDFGGPDALLPPPSPPPPPHAAAADPPEALLDAMCPPAPPRRVHADVGAFLDARTRDLEGLCTREPRAGALLRLGARGSEGRRRCDAEKEQGGCGHACWLRWADSAEGVCTPAKWKCVERGARACRCGAAAR